MNPVVPYRKRSARAGDTASAGIGTDVPGVPVCAHCRLSGDFVRCNEKSASRGAGRFVTGDMRRGYFASRRTKSTSSMTSMG